MCNGLLNDVVLAYCCAACWCGKRECVVRTCWMVWLMMSRETAKTACVDVGGKVWWLKWAVRQGLRAHTWVSAWGSEGEKERRKKRVLWQIFLRVLTAVPLTERPRFKSFLIWKEPPAWKFCECLSPLCPYTHHQQNLRWVLLHGIRLHHIQRRMQEDAKVECSDTKLMQADTHVRKSVKRDKKEGDLQRESQERKCVF